MNNPINIAIDAMGGDNSPEKVIEGISLHAQSSKNIIEDKKSGEYRLSHHMDLKTGFYKGRQVLDPKE